MDYLSKSMASISISLSSQVETSRNWLDLPPELTSAILTRVGTIDLLLSVRKVCKTWRRICSDPAMWRVVDIREINVHYLSGRWDHIWDYEDKLEEVAKQAVDLSCGQIIDFSAGHFGSDDLLRYISDRSSQLRRLRLVACIFTTDDELIKMVGKLPLLEELHLSYIPVSKGAIEVAGRCCPQLKSFSLTQHIFRYPDNASDDEALAIAENMPGLRHLQLRGNDMTNDGLMAILENCLHLESLDIRQCFNVSPGHDLAKRLSARQIKDLSLPFIFCKYHKTFNHRHVEYSSGDSDYEADLIIEDYLEAAFIDSELYGDDI